ncbi:MAG: alpha/beta hydrolase, partial [Acidovorax sp.]
CGHAPALNVPAHYALVDRFLVHGVKDPGPAEPAVVRSAGGAGLHAKAPVQYRAATHLQWP